MARNGQELKEEVRSARRSERKYKDLQPIRKDFYPTVEKYILDLNSNYAQIDPELVQRLDDTPTVVEDIIQARLKKIVTMAVMNEFGSSEPLDNLSLEERDFYNLVHSVTRQFHSDYKVRAGIEIRTELETARTEPVVPPVVEKPPVTAPEVPADVFDEGEAVPFPDDPDLFETEEPEMPPEDFPVIVDEPAPYIETTPVDVPAPVVENAPVEESAHVEGKTEEPAPVVDKRGNMVTIRVTLDLPDAISWKDGVNYLLKKGQLANIPSELAAMLISSGMAEQVNPSS